MKSVSQFNSSIPWQALISSMTLIDSHDTPRFRTIVDGDRCKHLSAMTLLLSYPGVPSIFMGDEIGLEGKSGEDSRRTIDWENRANWDTDFLDQVKSLVHLRRTRSGLSNGGLRWIDAGKDYVAFLRESKRESLLVFISSGRVELDLDLDQYGYRITETLFGPAQDGTKLRIRCSTATQGIWVLGSN
jgi:alpha-glucosidase